MATPFKYSDIGMRLTESFEGLELHTYADSGGVLTIGYGHTGKDVIWGRLVSPDQAIILLRSDLAAAESCVVQAVKVPIEQHHFDAMVDFAFNEGRGHFLRSTLLRHVNAGEMEAAAGCFSAWDEVGGKPSAGLARRRLAEENLFRGIV